MKKVFVLYGEKVMQSRPVSDVKGCTSEFLGFVKISVNGKAGTTSHLFGCGCVECHKVGLHAISLGTAGSVGGIRGCLGDFLKNAETRGWEIPRVHLRILPKHLGRIREKVAEGCPEHLLTNVTIEEYRQPVARHQAVATAGRK